MTERELDGQPVFLNTTTGRLRLTRDRVRATSLSWQSLVRRPRINKEPERRSAFEVAVCSVEMATRRCKPRGDPRKGADAKQKLHQQAEFQGVKDEACEFTVYFSFAVLAQQ